jgi:hypothetical protein
MRITCNSNNYKLKEAEADVHAQECEMVDHINFTFEHKENAERMLKVLIHYLN